MKKSAFKTPKRSENNDIDGNTQPGPGYKASTDIVGAFFSKYGQIADRFQTALDAFKPYKKAELKRSGDDWYVEYQYRFPPHLKPKGHRFKRFRVYRDFPKYVRMGEAHAIKYGETLVQIVNHMLKEGYNPFFEEVVEDIQREVEQDREQEVEVNLNSAINLFIEIKRQKGVRDRTISDYESYLGIFREYMASKGLLSNPVKSISTNDIEDYLNESARLRTWSARTFNNHRDLLVSMFSELIKWSKKNKGKAFISDNPAEYVELKLTKPSNHRYYTAEYAKEIKTFMKNRDPFIFDVCQFIYYSCTRPKVETRMIKIEHIDLERRVIRVPQGKTGYRYVPICQELYTWLQQKKIYDYPKHFYLFGKKGEISESPAGANYLTNRYKAIKDAMGIPPEYTLYGWKHTRCVDLVVAGLSTVEAMQITGHTDVESFEKYLRDLGAAMSKKVYGETVKF